MNIKYKLRVLLDKMLFGLQLKIYKYFNCNVSDYYMNNKIYYNPNTDIGNALFFSGQFESDELRLFGKYINDKSIVLDIGANIGLHSLYFSNLVTNGLVIAFEPSISTFENLLANIRSRDNILPLNMAVFDKCELKKFYVANDNAYSSLKDTGRKSIINIQNILCVKLDNILLEAGIDKIDFIKIDVEGFEMNALMGMTGLIDKYRPVLFCEIYKGDNSNDDPCGTVELLLEKGYKAFVVKEGNLVRYEKHDDRFYNYLFVPESSI